MLTSRVIPCLDVRDGRIVKGVRFANLRDAGDPAERAAMYEAQGADEIVILDVSATADGRATALETIRSVRAAVSIPLTVGGGIRSAEDAGALLDAGADKVSVNSAAVRDPALLARLAQRFGVQCTVLAIDAAQAATAHQWDVVVRGGSERTTRDVSAWAVEGTELGAGEILLTSWDRDGTHLGYDLDLITQVRSLVPVPIIASGGASTAEHMIDALRAGADAVLAASIFHDAQTTVSTLKQQLAQAGIEVRP
ncbi:MAG: imidazole glycerol phosphate synthase subunit HisF [Phycisphaerales bacterium]